MIFPTQATAIVVAALDVCPPRQAHRHQAKKKLLGIGLVSHHFAADSSIKLGLQTNATAVVANEGPMIDWLEDELTGCELLVADGLVDILALIRAKLNVDGHLGLAQLVNSSSDRLCDLSARRWFGGRQSFVNMCRSADVPVRPDSAVNVSVCWAASLTRPIHDHLANRAAAAWRLWASRQPGTDNPAVREGLDRVDEWLAACVAPTARSRG